MGAVVSLPTIKNRKVKKAATPIRGKSEEYRPRKHLLPAEAERLIKAAGKEGRNGSRDSTLLLLMYRHGLRVGEAVALRWSAIDWKAGTIHIERLKGSLPSTHPLSGVELRALRKLHREAIGDFIFMSELKGPLTTDTVRKLVQRAGEAAKIGWLVNPHALRHSCGYKLAAEGKDTRNLAHYLGHVNIANTAIYTALAPGKFKGWWKD